MFFMSLSMTFDLSQLQARYDETVDARLQDLEGWVGSFQQAVDEDGTSYEEEYGPDLPFTPAEFAFLADYYRVS